MNVVRPHDLDLSGFMLMPQISLKYLSGVLHVPKLQGEFSEVDAVVHPQSAIQSHTGLELQESIDRFATLVERTNR